MNRLSAVALLTLFGCGACAHSPRVAEWYNQQKLEPTQNVEVFRTQRPTRAYIELAELQVDDRNRKPTEALVQKAREIGADAIIMTGQGGNRQVFVPMGGMMIGRRLTSTSAIAIKYKE